MSGIRLSGLVAGQPNILIIMVEQLNSMLFYRGPKPFLHAPHLKNLAENSVCFPTCYTASPLCAPGRASFMSGQLPSRTRVYDNAAEFASSIPTYAHHLRRHGKSDGEILDVIYLPQKVLFVAALIIGKAGLAEKLLGILQVNISKAKHLLGWLPLVSLQDGLNRCFRKM